MAMRGFLGFVQFCVLIIHVTGQDVIHPKLKTGTKPENPGMRLRLMPTGLAFLREFGMKVISQEVPRIVLPSITENVDGARVTIKGARIDKYWAPEEYNLDLHPPNRFVWSMNQMHVRSTGQFQYGLRVAPASSPLLNAGGLFGRLGSTILDTAASFPLLQTEAEVSGTFEALLGEMSMAISVALSSTQAGAPFVQIDSCQLAIGYIDMNVRNTGILTDLVINTLKNLLTLRIKPMIEQRMCERIQSIIGKDVNRIMATMPLNVRLDQQQYDIIGSTLDNAGLPSGRPGVSKRLNKQIPKIDTSALNFIQNLRNQPMSIDYRLITSPFIDTGTITMFCKGEISWLGRGGTPFYPPDITVPLPQGAEMIQFFGTDYIANSMMYHAFQQKFLEMIIGPESSKQLSGMLKTTCDSGFCLGDVLGELGTAYPNREVEVRFSADKAPALFFEEGKATIGVTGFVRIFVRGNKTLGPKIMIVKTRMAMDANVYLDIYGNHIRGNATVDTLDFVLLETRIGGVTQDVMSDLGLFGAEFLGSLLTDIFQRGILIPTVQGVQLQNPTLSFHHRYVMIKSNFAINEQYLIGIISGAVQKSIQNSG